MFRQETFGKKRKTLNKSKTKLSPTKPYQSAVNYLQFIFRKNLL